MTEGIGSHVCAFGTSAGTIKNVNTVSIYTTLNDVSLYEGEESSLAETIVKEVQNTMIEELEGK